MNRVLAPFLCLALVTTACSDDKELSLASGGSQPLTPIVGAWASACAAGGANAQSNQLTLTFDATGTATRDRKFFSAVDCPVDALAYTLSENLSFGIIRKVSETEEKYDVNYESRTMTVTGNQATVDLWNQQIFCESVSWVADVPQDRSNKDCHDTQLVFDLIKVEANQLFFGEKSGEYSGRSNDERPLLTSTTPFTKL